jgi:hypothetical protein
MYAVVSGGSGEGEEKERVVVKEGAIGQGYGRT